MQVGQTRGVPKGAGAHHAHTKRKPGIFARLSRMSGNLNPFEEEEANPRHKRNLHMTVGKVGKLSALCVMAFVNPIWFYTLQMMHNMSSIQFCPSGMLAEIGTVLSHAHGAQLLQIAQCLLLCL